MNDAQTPNFRGVRVAPGTGYHRVEANRRASCNGRVSHLPPEIPNVTIRNLCIAVWVTEGGPQRYGESGRVVPSRAPECSLPWPALSASHELQANAWFSRSHLRTLPAFNNCFLRSRQQRECAETDALSQAWCQSMRPWLRAHGYIRTVAFTEFIPCQPGFIGGIWVRPIPISEGVRYMSFAFGLSLSHSALSEPPRPTSRHSKSDILQSTDSVGYQH